MLFKLDEDLRSDIGDPLRDLGRDVSTVYGQELRGKEDQEIADACRFEGRITIRMSHFSPERGDGEWDAFAGE